jgi:hypothetical protein
MDINAERLRVIEEKIKEKEGINSAYIKVNTSEFMREVTGKEKVNQYYLILASRVFKKRGWTQHFDKKRVGSKRYWLFFNMSSDLDLWG